MKAYFSGKMGFGRYPEKTISEVFSHDRMYFDQVVYKNSTFRADYSQALYEWLGKLGLPPTPGQTLTMRALVAVELMGEEKVEKLFRQLVSYLNDKWPDRKLPADLKYREVLARNYAGFEDCRPQIRKMETFWERLAIPMVEEI